MQVAVLASFETMTEKSADRIQAFSLSIRQTIKAISFIMKEKLGKKVFKVKKGEKTFKSRSLKRNGDGYLHFWVMLRRFMDNTLQIFTLKFSFLICRFQTREIDLLIDC